MTTISATPATLSRPKNIALWTLQVLTSALLAFGAFSKLSDDPLAIAGFEQIGAGQWLRYFVGVAEAAAAVGLLVPILSGLASLGLVALLTGATVITAAQNPISYIAMPAATLAVVAVLAWARRDTTRRLISRLTKNKNS